MKRIFGISLFLILVSSIYGTNYYVSPSGSDTDSGISPGHPFRTINKAASVAAPGDSVLVMAGTYDEYIRPVNSGTPLAPITFRNYNNEEVILTNSGNNYCFRLTNLEYLIIDGFTFLDAYAWIHLEGGGHHLIRNCTFNGARSYQCLWVNNSSYNIIINCRFLKAQDGSPDTNHSDYIPIYGNSHYNLIESCEFHWITHIAISVEELNNTRTPSHNVIRKCYFDTPGWKCIGIFQSEYTLVEYNTMTGMAGQFVQLQGPFTIFRYNQFYDQTLIPGRNEPGWDGTILLRTQNAWEHQHYNQQIPQHNRIYHNVFYNNAMNIAVRPYLQRESDSPNFLVLDNIFLNNIFYKNGQFLYLTENGQTIYAEYLFDNNLIYGTSANQTMIHLRGDYTLSQAQTTLPEHFKNNFEAIPIFVNETERDFHLQEGSPGINQGKPLAVTVGAGSGNQVPVTDALPFCDGYGVVGGDEIIIGDNEPVVVLQVDYFHNILTISKDISWGDKDPVSLFYLGTAPDIGIYEYGDSVLRIITAALPYGQQGQFYWGQLEAVNGSVPLTWSLESGNLPVGLTLFLPKFPLFFPKFGCKGYNKACIFRMIFPLQASFSLCTLKVLHRRLWDQLLNLGLAG